MRKQLTPEDIKILRYECRPGIIAAFVIFVIGLIFFLIFVISISGNNLMGDIASNLQYLLVHLLLSGFIAYLLCDSFLSDIRNGEKIIEVKKLKKKIASTSYEAGSGTLYPFQDMKANGVYHFIIENTRYMVDEELYNQCVEGDEIEFHIAPKSKCRIRMSRRKRYPQA
jgi:hypothetical protein